MRSSEKQIIALGDGFGICSGGIHFTGSGRSIGARGSAKATNAPATLIYRFRERADELDYNGHRMDRRNVESHDRVHEAQRWV